MRGLEKPKPCCRYYMHIKTRILLFIVVLLLAFLVACKDKGRQMEDTKSAALVRETVVSYDEEESGTNGRNDLPDYGNNPPEITEAKLIADLDQEGVILRARVTAVDKDDDEISFEYRWEKNGLVQNEQGDVLRDFKRGDKIVLTVRAFDWRSYGKSVSLGTEIANTAPFIERDDEFSVDGKIFTKRIRAKDADGDRLVFQIEKGPEGMKLDESGLLTWPIPPDVTGNFTARIIVSDGHGGKVSYDIEIPITLEEEKK